MEKLKIRVTTEQESKEAQGLFFDLGCYIDYPKKCLDDAVVLFSESCGLLTYSSTETYTNDGVVYKEITLQELRDMVVLKRNDPKDGTHIDGHYKDIVWFRKSSGGYHKFDEKTNKWSGEYPITYVDACNLIPIKEEVMKEYLFKYNDQYTLVELSKEDAESNPEQYIEVPVGAEVLTVIFGDNIFYKSGNPWKWYSEESKKWMECSDVVGLDGFQNVLWQREKESPNDKIATAEVARQKEKHNHYKKDVSHLNMIDPYRIADLYNLHPCADHIMKKSLCAGNRGHKDTLRDIQDIIDTAERWKQMIEEDSNEI